MGKDTKQWAEIGNRVPGQKRRGGTESSRQGYKEIGRDRTRSTRMGSGGEG